MKMEWIDVKDHEPPKINIFLAFAKIGFYCEGLVDDRKSQVQTCYWNDFEKKYRESCNCSGPVIDHEYIEITHWMPLPEPPKE